MTAVGRPWEELRHCAVCARETWFETPLCDDATGGPLLDELVCVECGTAVLVAAPAPVLTPTRAPSHHAA